MQNADHEAVRVIARAFCRAARVDASAGTAHPTRIPCPCEQRMLAGRKPACHADKIYGAEAAAAVIDLKRAGLLKSAGGAYQTATESDSKEGREAA